MRVGAGGRVRSTRRRGAAVWLPSAIAHAKPPAVETFLTCMAGRVVIPPRHRGPRVLSHHKKHGRPAPTFSHPRVRKAEREEENNRQTASPPRFVGFPIPQRQATTESSHQPIHVRLPLWRRRRRLRSPAALRLLPSPLGPAALRRQAPQGRQDLLLLRVLPLLRRPAPAAIRRQRRRVRGTAPVLRRRRRRRRIRGTALQPAPVLRRGRRIRGSTLQPAPVLRRGRRIRGSTLQPAPVLRRRRLRDPAHRAVLWRPAALVGAVWGSWRLREPVRDPGAVGVPAGDRPKRGGVLPGGRPRRQRDDRRQGAAVRALRLQPELQPPHRPPPHVPLHQHQRPQDRPQGVYLCFLQSSELEVYI